VVPRVDCDSINNSPPTSFQTFLHAGQAESLASTRRIDVEADAFIANGEIDGVPGSAKMGRERIWNRRSVRSYQLLRRNADSLRVAPGRRLASLMPASWNHIVEWLGLLDGLRRASRRRIRLFGRASAFGVLSEESAHQLRRDAEVRFEEPRQGRR
jgi:hypothetical protein